MSKEDTQRSSEEDEKDVVSEAIGEYGRWQLRLTCLLAFFNVPCTWHIFSPTFQAASQEKWCARPDDLQNLDPILWRNITQPKDECTIVNYSSVNYTMDNITNIISLLNSTDNLIECTDWEYNGKGIKHVLVKFTVKTILYV